METDPEMKELGIQGVFQLQGGIDKYFKEFPEGGYWKGKNCVFDKRFAHAPPKVDGELHGKVNTTSMDTTNQDADAATTTTTAEQQIRETAKHAKNPGICTEGSDGVLRVVSLV
jgi:predicted sulfurtransferase